jgi:uncharacterized protein
LIRAILDTHIWLEYLLWESPRLDDLRQWQANRRIVFVIDEPCAFEFSKVLSYPQFALPAKRKQALVEQQKLLCDWIPMHVTEQSVLQIPPCKDPNDQKFLQLLVYSNSQYLISRDKKLRKTGRHRFFKQRGQKVITLEECLSIFAQDN